jgi:uncharacterized cupin superfamily protein
VPLALLIAASDLSNPEEGAPDADRIVSGAPRFRTWNRYEDVDERLYCGIWEATPGAWRVRYDEWESCTLLAGHSVVTPDGGASIDLRPGDTLVIEPGFSGIWEVRETTRKTYVIRLPAGL